MSLSATRVLCVKSRSSLIQNSKLSSYHKTINKSMSSCRLKLINHNHFYNHQNFAKLKNNYSNLTSINQNVPHSHNPNDVEHTVVGAKIESAFYARQFIKTLSLNERQIIKEELIKAEAENQLLQNGQAKVIESPSWRQILIVCFQNGLPFIGFGFVDNFLMIVAGDMIESYIGFFFPISTMAAAGFGNALSDVAGIGLAHHIDYFCSKLIGEPKLTPEQYTLSIVNWSMVISKSLCIFIGCIIGMFPLLFITHESDKDKKDAKKSDQVDKQD